MSALIPRRLTPDEHLEIEGGFADLHELFPRPVREIDAAMIRYLYHDAGNSMADIVRCFSPRIHPVEVRTVIFAAPQRQDVEAKDFGRGSAPRPEPDDDGAAYVALGILTGVLIGCALVEIARLILQAVR